MNRLTLTPAYGRDYKSKKEVLADWEADKDFVSQPSGSYINKSGAEQLAMFEANIRYKKIQNVCVLRKNVKTNKWQAV